MRLNVKSNVGGKLQAIYLLSENVDERKNCNVIADTN